MEPLKLTWTPLKFDTPPPVGEAARAFMSTLPSFSATFDGTCEVTPEGEALLASLMAQPAETRATFTGVTRQGDEIAIGFRGRARVVAVRSRNFRASEIRVGRGLRLITERTSTRPPHRANRRAHRRALKRGK